MRSLLLIILWLLAAPLGAQLDSVAYVQDAQPDGIFLSYQDFRHNRYIGKEQVVSDISKNQLEFMGKVMSQEKFTFNAGGSLTTMETATAWGFFQNKTLYINFKGDFYRVPVFGAICYLVATVTVMNSGFYDPMYGYGVTASRTKEIRDFMMDFYDGRVVEFSLENAEFLLSRDPALLAEYKALGKRQRREQVNRYIRRYNELHPVYFLK